MVHLRRLPKQDCLKQLITRSRMTLALRLLKIPHDFFAIHTSSRLHTNHSPVSSYHPIAFSYAILLKCRAIIQWFCARLGLHGYHEDGVQRRFFLSSGYPDCDCETRTGPQLVRIAAMSCVSKELIW